MTYLKHATQSLGKCHSADFITKQLKYSLFNHQITWKNRKSFIKGKFILIFKITIY